MRDEARSLLETTRWGVDRIALACGFGMFLALTLLGLPWPGSSHVGDKLPAGEALVMTYSIALLTFTLDYMRVRLAAHEVRTEAAQRQAVESQLQLLRAQLDPHMMFNTLANLHALIEADPPRAQAMLEHLITFLRATLQGSRSLSHPLRDEFARLEDYLALMQIRMGARLQVTLDLPPALVALQVPTLLLQPLVENAIRHGIETCEQGGTVGISLLQSKATVTLLITNPYCGSRDKAAHNGVALQNIGQRLQLFFGQAASISCNATPDSYRVKLVLPKVNAEAER